MRFSDVPRQFEGDPDAMIPAVAPGLHAEPVDAVELEMAELCGIVNAAEARLTDLVADALVRTGS